MKRLNHVLLALLIGLPMLLLVSACGPDDDKARPRIPQSRLKPHRAAQNMSPEERQALFVEKAERTAQSLIWPEGQGPSRDAVADSVACQEAAAANPKVANTNPLLRLTWLGRCLREKGWKIDPDTLQAGG
jgi:hypothetical protein